MHLTGKYTGIDVPGTFEWQIPPEPGLKKRINRELSSDHAYRGVPDISARPGERICGMGASGCR